MMEAPTRTRPPMDPDAAMYGHSRSRTTSSNVFPSQQPLPPQQHYSQQQQQYYAQQQQQYPSQQQQYIQQQQQHQQQQQQFLLQQQQLQQQHQQLHQIQQQQQQQQQQQYHQPQQLHPHHYSQQHPQMHSAQQYHAQQQQQPPPQSASNPQLWRRSPSIGAFSTSSSFQQPPPAAYRTSTSDLRRSTSSRSVGTVNQYPSGGGSGSYVALLRKQKATVWCERAQYEDPRALAQQRAAKMRANLEVVSGNSARTQTGLASAKVAGKIRHGKTPVVGYAPGETHVGVGGVPLRLSAREIDGDGSDDDDTGPMMASRKEPHRRAGSSGRSSTGSGRQGQNRTSGSGTPARHQSLAGTPERTASLANNTQTQQKQQQQQQPTQPSIDESAGPTNDAASGRAQSSRSGHSATPSERRDDVVELGQGPKLAHNSKFNSALTREKSVKNPEELKRRGSVDERTATLTSGRLFIANPD